MQRKNDIPHPPTAKGNNQNHLENNPTPQHPQQTHSPARGTIQFRRQVQSPTECTLPPSQHGPADTPPPQPSHPHERHTPPYKTSHNTQNTSGYRTPEIRYIGRTRRQFLDHPPALQRSSPTPSPQPLYSLPHLECPPPRMEDSQLRGRPQDRQEILLTTQIVLANLTSIMLRQTARNHNRETTRPRCAGPHTPHRWVLRQRTPQSMPSSEQSIRSPRQSARSKQQINSHHDRWYSPMTSKAHSTRFIQQHSEKSCCNGGCHSTSRTGSQHSTRTGNSHLTLTNTPSNPNRTSAAYHKDPPSHQFSSSSTATQC